MARPYGPPSWPQNAVSGILGIPQAGSGPPSVGVAPAPNADPNAGVWGTANDPRIARIGPDGSAYDSDGRPIGGPAVGGQPINAQGGQQGQQQAGAQPPAGNGGGDSGFQEGGDQFDGGQRPPAPVQPPGGGAPATPVGPQPPSRGGQQKPAPGQLPSGLYPMQDPDLTDTYRQPGSQGNIAPNGRPYGPNNNYNPGASPGGAGGRGGQGGAGGQAGGGMAPQGPGAGQAPGGNAPKGPAGPNPALGQALQNLGNQYGDAYRQALAANQQRYQGILDLYHQAGQRQLQNQQNIDQRYNALQGQTQAYLDPMEQALNDQKTGQAGVQGRYDQNTAQTLADIQGIDASQRQQIKDQYAQASGAATNSLAARGLGNWTVADSVQRGLLADREKAEINLTNQTQALTAGYGSQLRGAAAGYAGSAIGQNTAQANAAANARAGYGSNIGNNAINALADAGRQNTALDLSQANFMNSVQTPYPDPNQFSNLANQLGQLYGGGSLGGGAGPGGSYPQGGYYPMGGGGSSGGGTPSYQPYYGNAPSGGAPPLAYGPSGSLGQFGAGGAISGLGLPGGFQPQGGDFLGPSPVDYGGWGYGGGSF